MRIIFDTDSAVFNDDAAALAMLLQRRDLVEILGVTVVAALTMGATRYRVPAEVALVLLAAVTLDALAAHYLGRWRHRTNEGTARTLLR